LPRTWPSRRSRRPGAAPEITRIQCGPFTCTAAFAFLIVMAVATMMMAVGVLAVLSKRRPVFLGDPAPADAGLLSQPRHLRKRPAVRLSEFRI
jgi:hypothetical protein